MKLSVVILAAGQGKRMRSAVPKVLHPLAEKPLLGHVLDTARALQPSGLYVVYGHGGEQVRAAITAEDIVWVEQAEQLGTGHALMQALPDIPDEHQVLVLYGDVPLIQAASLQHLLEQGAAGLGLLTMHLSNPRGYGRIVRDTAGQVREIVEEKDADAATRAITEVNTGILTGGAGYFRRWLSNLSNDNAQGEYYLTDTIALAVAEKLPVATAQVAEPQEVQGVNNRVQLAELERYYQRRQAEQLMAAGVTLRDPARLDVRGKVETGIDCLLDVNVVLEGEVKLGARVRIGPHCVLRDVSIGDDTEILANSVLESAIIGAACRIGPFARIRPDTVLAERVHIGNFVELKKSQVAAGSKINHLSYIGDTEVGAQVNIGAGTITCNYDGANKHKTVIEDRAFIGSDTQLVAPVTVGAGATIGAGSTITRDTPEDTLTLSRSPQKSIKGWRRPQKSSR